MERGVERDNVRSRGGGRQRRGEGRQVPPRVFQRKAWAGGRVRGRGAVWGANHVGAGPGVHAVLFGGAQPQLLFFLWHCLHVSARHLLVSPCGFAEGAAAMPVSPRTLPSDVPTNKYQMQTYLRGPLGGTHYAGRAAAAKSSCATGANSVVHSPASAALAVLPIRCCLPLQPCRDSSFTSPLRLLASTCDRCASSNVAWVFLGRF